MTNSAYLSARDLLELEGTGDDIFRNAHNLDNGRNAIFGGQPLLQGLAAAQRTIDGWPAHNLSAQYLRAGNPHLPIDFHVQRVRDGRRFATRHVVAMQEGKPIFDMLCSFHDPEDGPAHEYLTGAPMPDPETLQNLASFIAEHPGMVPARMAEVYGAPFPVELRLVDPKAQFLRTSTIPVRDYWFRMASAAEISDPLDHQCLLAFMTDYWFAGTAAAMHVVPSQSSGVAVVTLNHSLWFHAPLRADDWLLYRTDSPWAGQGRGLVRGSIQDSSGALVASAVQELSIRQM